MAANFSLLNLATKYSGTLDLVDNILQELNKVRGIIFKIELNTQNTNSVNITSDIKFKFDSYLEIKLDGI